MLTCAIALTSRCCCASDRIVSKMAKLLRQGKVFIDWSQNADYKTTVAPYSLRAKAKPTVSMPVTWEELDKPRLFDPEEAIARVKKVGDLFAPVLTMKQRLPLQQTVRRAKSPALQKERDETRLPKPTMQGRWTFKRPSSDAQWCAESSARPPRRRANTP